MNMERIWNKYRLNTPLKRKVLVGMSGGVDSSVSAALLLRDGYEVVGGFIKNWSDTKDLWTGECAWRGERRDAMRVAAKLGIPLLTFDFEEAYRRTVVDELFRGYEAGETPNPDVLCNEQIKFGLFFDEAIRLGFDFVATGHYAQVAPRRSRREVGIPIRVSGSLLAGPDVKSGSRSEYRDRSSQVGSCASENDARRPTSDARLLRGFDSEKDQSYFLYRISQNVLRCTLFPIGNLQKSMVRKIARELNLPVAEKPDSQGICFIGKLDMVEFLRKKIPSHPGEIVDEEGNVLGRHDGLDGYTIGQRERIRIQSIKSKVGLFDAWYVAEKDIQRNRLVVVQGAEHPRLFATVAKVRDIHWIADTAPSFPLECDVQVRYRQEPVRARMIQMADGRWQIDFVKPVKAVAPGQSAVFYQGEECLGGGILTSSFTSLFFKRQF